jgi:DNA-binding transcriptional regulator LsrR (DeoR family)
MKRSTKKRKGAGHSGLRKPGRPLDSPHEVERITGLVCHYFCKGYSPAAIAFMLEREHGIKISREAPYRYLSYATTRNWLRFTPPPQVLLGEQFRSRYPHLQQVDVVDTTMADGIMERAADVVMDLVQAKVRPDKSVVHIGFAGGRSMALLASKLAPRLHEAREPMPAKIICQNLVAGFDIRDPKSNPISFLSLLTGAKANGLQVESILFQAPAIVKLSLRGELLGSAGIKEAAEAAWKADIIVTSCGGFDDPHQQVLPGVPRHPFLPEVARLCGGYALAAGLSRRPVPFRYPQ